MMAALAGGPALAADEATGAGASAEAVNPELLEQIRKDNAQCYSCHSEQGLAHPPRADLDLVKLRDLLLDDADFKLSAHGQMACKTCHGQAFEVFPHAEGGRASISSCQECHAVKALKIEKQFHASAHADLGKMTCLSCHDPHLFNTAAKMESPQSAVAQDNGICLNCHESEELFRAMAAPDKKRPDLDRIHKWLPNHRLHWSAVRCVECHTPMAKAKAQPHEILGSEKAERDCVTCHTRETALRVRLYRHLAETEQETLGFANSVILSDHYVIGATRNRYVDIAVLALAGLTLAGVLGHGALRILARLGRRRRK
jgi:predicted CXXCH cytochrome family protein